MISIHIACQALVCKNSGERLHLYWHAEKSAPFKHVHRDVQLPVIASPSGIDTELSSPCSSTVCLLHGVVVDC